MSKKKVTAPANSVSAGDVVRLVYEIAISSVDDLDTVIASEASGMLVISGTVKKGPLRGQAVRFAVSGDDVLSIVGRRTRSQAISDHLRQGVQSLAEWFMSKWRAVRSHD